MELRFKERDRGVLLRKLDFDRLQEQLTAQVRRAEEALGDPAWEEVTVLLGTPPYAIGESLSGRMYVICEEGVGWEVADDIPLPVDVYVSHGSRVALFPKYQVNVPLAEIMEVRTDEIVDLADLVRVFGRRLESNFWLWKRRMTEEDCEHDPVTYQVGAPGYGTVTECRKCREVLEDRSGILTIEDVR